MSDGIKWRTRNEIVAELLALVDEARGSTDVESNHGKADDLLCQLLRWHGEDEAADAFDSMEKWYA